MTLRRYQNQPSRNGPRRWSFEADVQARVLFHQDKQDAGWDICHYDWDDLTEDEQFAYVQRALDK